MNEFDCRRFLKLKLFLVSMEIFFKVFLVSMEIFFKVSEMVYSQFKELVRE